MRVTPLLSGLILAAIGGYVYSRSSDVLEFLKESPSFSLVLTSLLGSSVAPIILIAQMASLAALFIGFLGIVYGIAVPTKNKPKDLPS